MSVALILETVICCGQATDEPAYPEILSLLSPDGTPAKGYPFGAMPMYPLEMKRARIAGEVTVRIGVNPSGRVVRVETIKSSHREFEPSVIAAASKWQVFVFDRDNPSAEREIVIDCRIKFSFPEDEEPAAWTKKYAKITTELNEAFQLLKRGGELPKGSLRSPARIASYEDSMVVFHGVVALKPVDPTWFRILISRESLAYDDGDWVTAEPLVLGRQTIRDAAHGGTVLTLKRKPSQPPLTLPKKSRQKSDY